MADTHTCLIKKIINKCQSNFPRISKAGKKNFLNIIRGKFEITKKDINDMKKELSECKKSSRLTGS